MVNLDRDTLRALKPSEGGCAKASPGAAYVPEERKAPSGLSADGSAGRPEQSGKAGGRRSQQPWTHPGLLALSVGSA